MEPRSLLAREFDNLWSDDSLVSMDLPSKMAWILMKKWQMQIWTNKDRIAKEMSLEF